MDFARSVLIAAGALWLHVISITGLVAHFRVLPTDRLEALRQRWGGVPTTGSGRWMDILTGALLAVVATALIVVMLGDGGYTTLLATGELLIAAAWLIYLLRTNRGPRP